MRGRKKRTFRQPDWLLWFEGGEQFPPHHAAALTESPLRAGQQPQRIDVQVLHTTSPAKPHAPSHRRADESRNRPYTV